MPHLCDRSPRAERVDCIGPTLPPLPGGRCERPYRTGARNISVLDRLFKKDNNQLEEDLEVQKMKMRAEQLEEAYKKQKRMPTKLKPRVFGCFWKLDFEQNSAIAENNNKDRIVHDQLMKILKPYGSVVMLTDSIDENPNESAIPFEPSISNSAPKTIIAPPKIVTIIANSIFSPIQVSSNSSSSPNFFE